MKTIKINTRPEICYAYEFSAPVYKNEFRPYNCYIEIIEVTEGFLKLTEADSSYIAKAGDIICNFYEGTVSISTSKPHTHRSVCARVKWCETAYGLSIPYFLKSTECKNIHNMLAVLISQRRIGLGNSENSSKLFSDILNEIDRITKEKYFSQQELYVQKAKQYVLERLRLPITQKEVSNALGITSGYLCAVFKKVNGSTLMQYINRQKLSAIKADMQKEGIKLYEASARYGYADPHYVSRLYKKMFKKNITDSIDEFSVDNKAEHRFKFEKQNLPQPVYEGRDDLIGLYYKAWELVFDNIDYVNKKGWKPNLTCMPGIGILWQWDSCFMTFFTNYSNGNFSAFNNLDNLYRLRRETDGYISMAYRIESESEAYGERINPPLYAWAEWEHYLISGDSSRFLQVIDAVEGLYGFIEKKRRRENGLYFFEDSNSSGMSGAPRGSAGRYNSGICFVDLACQQSLSADCLSKIYSFLGNSQKAEFYKAENIRINRLVNKYHYCEKTGFYYDLFLSDRKRTVFIANKTAAAFWVLLCGAATDERLESVVKHLMSPDEFYTHTPFATLSKDDPNFDPAGGDWLGSSRHPTTFAAVSGLYRCGFKDKAHQATIEYLNVMSEVASDKRYGSIWECYSPEMSCPATKGDGRTVMSNFVGWGGIGPITMFIENVIGLHFDAFEKTVTFDITTDGECGIKNMMFNGTKVSVIHKNGTVSVTTEKPFTLKITKNGLYKSVDIAIGEQLIEV